MDAVQSSMAFGGCGGCGGMACGAMGVGLVGPVGAHLAQCARGASAVRLFGHVAVLETHAL